MKVLHVAHTLPGGIAAYLDEVIPHQLAALGDENVRVLAPIRQIDHLARVPARRAHGFADDRRSLGGLWRFYRALRRLVSQEQPDLIHLHSSFAGAVGRLAFLFRRDRPTIVYCAHGWAFNTDRAGFRPRLYALIERLLARASDALIVISESERRAALRAGLPAGKLRLIHNGIAHRAVAAARGDAQGPLRLLFVGRLDRQKGIETLIQAIELTENRSVELDIVGAGVLDAEATVAHPNVRSHGWQSRARIEAFLLDCDALIVPSRWEGFGLVAAEAMRAGRAVIASRVGALPELVVEGKTGHLFPADDAPALASILRRAARGDLTRMGTAGRRRYEERFTADRMNDALLTCYHEANNR